MSKKKIFWILPLIFMVWSCSEDSGSILIEDDAIAPSSEITVSDEIFKLVNEHRQSISKPKLTRSTTTDELAIEHVNYMISKNRISHDGFNARFQILQQRENAHSAGENVAASYPNAVSVMNAWLNSSGHKSNIEGNYTHIGIAAIKNSQGNYYYTQLFYR
jgi:uncharacterized protein YkwD